MNFSAMKTREMISLEVFMALNLRLAKLAIEKIPAVSGERFASSPSFAVPN
jgi:hypothetical protein